LILDEADLALITRQCEHQKDDSPESIAAFVAAYSDAKGTITNELILGPDIILKKVLEWGKMTKPAENAYGFRNIPVVAGFNVTLKPQLVPRAMEGWCEDYWFHLFSGDPKSRMVPNIANKLYKEFEEIHPFRDGNGRVGHLIWAIAKRELEGVWPMELPPDLWERK
jgi:hypothetical protein